MAFVDEGDTVGARFTCFWKVFDLVDGNIIINKLSAYNSSNSVVYFIPCQQATDSGSGPSFFFFFFVLSTIRSTRFDHRTYLIIIIYK